MFDPFAFVRSVVTGNNFIGRTKELSILRNNTLQGASSFIVGLPRMGKSSLIANCFFEDTFFTPRKWMDDAGYVPLYFVVSESSSPEGLLDTISSELVMYLDSVGMSLDYLERVIEIPGLDAKFQIIKRALGDLKKNLGKSFVFIFDEFDDVRRYPKGTDILKKLRSLSLFGPLVICSRRLPDNIEEELSGTHYFTKFANCLFVGLFSDDEVKEYWNRFSVHFSSFNKEELSEYKSLVKRYVGNHPMLMSLMNSWLFQQGDDPFEFWHPGLPDSQREDAERSIRVEIKEAFLEQMRYVEEQKLKDTAIQLVVGSSHKPESKDIKLLKDYRFILEVPNKEKRDIFGYELGPTTADIRKRYICFSALTSHMMKDLYDPDIKGYDLLKKTELDLREIVVKYLDSICSDPFGNDESGYERWVPFHYARIETRFRTDHDEELFYDAINSMADIRDKRKSNDCKPSFDRTSITMVNSATLGEIWNVFIKNQWREFFADILDPADRCHGKGNLWYDNAFKIILDWRNAANHYNDEELSDEFLSKATLVAREVDRDICRWLGSGRD